MAAVVPSHRPHHRRIRLGLAAVVGLGACGPGAGPSKNSPAETGAPGAVLDTADSGGPASWRSTLYPADWTPGFATEDGMLRDFSHAGYHAGARALPEPVAEGAVDVLGLGADPTATEDSTAAIQAAIDSLSGPGVVLLPAGLYRVDGTLTVETPGVVLLGEGSETSRLWFTLDSGIDHGAHLTFRGRPTSGEGVSVLSDVVPGDETLRVATGSGLSVGDEVWVGITITPEFVSDHDMDGYWTFSLDQWRPFFRRTVVDVTAEGDAESVRFDVSLPYGLSTRDDLRVAPVDGYLTDVGLVGIGVSNAVDWDAAWDGNQVHAVAFEGVKDAFIRDLATFESPDAAGYHLQSSGVLVRNSRRITVAESALGYSQHRGEGGNGYLVDVRVSNGVLVRDTRTVAGRHNFIQNWDFGTSDLVFLRTHSAGAEAFTSRTDPSGVTACSETHHALAIAVLVDDSTVDDCWKMVNRLSYSSGAGHTATESVFWNVRGTGTLTSHQFGRGYVVGTEGLEVTTEVIDIYESYATAPEDFVEGLDQAATLEPQSLYEDQLARRLAR